MESSDYVATLKKDGVVQLPNYDPSGIKIPDRFSLQYSFKPHKEEAEIPPPPLAQELLPVATGFFGKPPNHYICRVVHTYPTTHKEPIGSQSWHRDPKAMGCFLYLTDVEEENGPFCYIKGSHLGKGTEWPVEDKINFVGPKGTLIIADLSGYHRGLKPTKDRYMLGLFYRVV